jgi:integrase
VRRDFTRFLIAVRCRRGEATSLDWQHLDLESAIWSQPAKLTKNGEPHRPHLDLLALDLLRARHETARKPEVGLVFPAPGSQGMMMTWRNVENELVTANELSGWRFHDMRRSFACAPGEEGAAEPISDSILNHRQAATRSGVLGLYQRAVQWSEQMALMQRWGTLLTTAIERRAARNKDPAMPVGAAQCAA